MCISESCRRQAGGYRIQVDNKVVAIDQLVDYLAESRSGMSPDEAQEMTVALSADKDVDMKTVMEVKQALRRANALKVTFIGTRINKSTSAPTKK